MPSGLRIFFCLITYLISLLKIGLFRFSASSWFSLGRLHFFRNLFAFKLLHLLAYYCSQWSHIVLCIYVVSVVRYHVSFLILFISILFLLRLDNFFQFFKYFQKKIQLLVLLIFSIVLSFSATYFCSNLYDFLPLQTWGLVWSFSTSLRYKVRLFIWDLSFILM